MRSFVLMTCVAICRRSKGSSLLFNGHVHRAALSAQAPVPRDRQSDQSLPPYLVGSGRLRSFRALITQDIGGHHSNSQRTNFFHASVVKSFYSNVTLSAGD